LAEGFAVIRRVLKNADYCLLLVKALILLDLSGFAHALDAGTQNPTKEVRSDKWLEKSKNMQPFEFCR
jgi:hypothetical protein